MLFPAVEADDSWDDLDVVPDTPAGNTNSQDPYCSVSQGIGTPSGTPNLVSPSISVPTNHFDYSGRRSTSSFGESTRMYTSHNTYAVDSNEESFTQNEMFGYRNGGHGLNLNARFYSQ